jgi:alkylation response protein AidB-like acyl-CoA dehydrogenase
MSATLSPEQLEIQNLARDFAVGELRPYTAAWDEQRSLDEDVFEKLAELGFMGMLIPEAYGGLEFDLTTYVRVIEELAWGDGAVALSVAIHNGPVAGVIQRFGTEAQKERWLPQLASGELLGAFALSEPDVGSDLRAVQTRARRDADGWSITGTKRWVTNGGRAGLVVVLALTDDRHTGAFLVDPTTEGYRVIGGESTMGLRASQTSKVELDAVRVLPEALLGPVSGGLAATLEALDVGRVGIAAQAVGIGRAAMEHATRYSTERMQFGRSLAKFGAVRAKLAEMARLIAGARALNDQAGRAVQASRGKVGHPRTGPEGVTAMAAMAKLAASEAATWVADEAIQVFGGYGYMRDYPVEKLLRDAKGTEIYEGTNEIMRHVIAREVLRASEEN